MAENPQQEYTVSLLHEEINLTINPKTTPVLESEGCYSKIP